MAIILDKTVRNNTWFRKGIDESVQRAVYQLCLSLQKTPIYASGARRGGARLVSDAKEKMAFRLANLSKLDVKSEVLLRNLNPLITNNDCADLVAKFSVAVRDWVVIVEYDAARADQVAKKFVSRIAQMPRNNLIYIACCYSGTQCMSLPEVEKYFSYMASISEAMGLAAFVGMVPPRNRG